MELSYFFIHLGLSSKESQILTSLYKLGARSASVIAKHSTLERTLCYKILQKLQQEGYVIMTKKRSIAYFAPAGIEQLQQKLQQLQERTQLLQSSFPDIKTTITSYQEKQFSFAPHINLFDGSLGIEQLFDDILRSTQEQGIGLIKILASNTLDAISLSQHHLHDYGQKIFSQLKKKQISTDIYLANGITIMEELIKTIDLETLINLPAGHSAINCYIVGHSFYIVIFDDIPYGIKIQSKLLASLMHFLLEKVNINLQ